MKTFTAVTLAVCLTLYAVFGLWMLTRFRHWFTGLIGVLLLLAGAYGIYRSAAYIAWGVIWGIRLAAVCAVYAFIFFGFPLRRRAAASPQKRRGQAAACRTPQPVIRPINPS